MAVSCGRTGILLITLILFVSSVENSKLNVPRVLLPIFKQFSTNFTLEVTESGCYKWTSSRIDVVQVTHINVDRELDCSTRAIVSAISKEETRNTAIIFAEEVHSGQLLRCDVIVDVISNLNIVTTTRELYMEEAPEAFEVRAYDDQGNEFTTLEGVEFQWSLGNLNPKPDYSRNPVLRFITFQESPYETPCTIEAFEQKGLKGHMVLLEGIKTGSAKVSVRLPHQEYQHVKIIEVQLMVVANLIIDPPDAYILLGDTVTYRIRQVQHGKLVDIPMPSSQYFLEMEDASTASINEETSVATGEALGRTKVLLHDRNVDEQDAGVRVPTAQLNVVDPSYLTLAILPHRNWALMVGERYEIVVEVYDSGDHKLLLGPGVHVDATIPDSLFHVSKSTANNTHHAGTPIAPGSAPVSATLEAVVTPRNERNTFTPPVQAHAEMSVYDIIKVTPELVVLPWDPITKTKYEVSLSASGGDGTYLWSCGNASVASVTQSGVVKTHGAGGAQISAAMARNHHNRGEARILVLPPRRLQIVQYTLEAEVGGNIALHVAMFADGPDGVQLPFTRCDEIPFELEIAEPIFQRNSSVKESPAGTACAVLVVTGSSPGTSKVTVTYTSEGMVMEDRVTIAAYSPLAAQDPVSGETVLALGSSRMIVFTGGPRPWLGRQAHHKKEMETNGESLTTNEKATELPDMYAYSVLCTNIGTVELKLTVANTPAMKHGRRAECSASVRVHCASPRYIQLRPRLAIALPEKCPMNLNAEKFIAQSFKDIELDVLIKDKFGRVFDNISSLVVSWKVSDMALGDISAKDTTLFDGTRQYQKIMPRGQTGTLQVSASVTGYKSSLLKMLHIEPDLPVFGVADEDGLVETPDISSSLSIILVNDTVIEPNRVTVFSHPSNKVSLKVSQGSGFYEFVLSAANIANVTFDELTRTVLIIPKKAGKLKLALVDVCLGSTPAIAEISVVGIGAVLVEAADRVEKGKTMTVIVRLLDDEGFNIPLPKSSLLDLVSQPQSDLISVVRQEREGTEHEALFLLTGVMLGDTAVAFSAGSVRSALAPVQVFPPLRLFPRNLTLVAGTMFQVTSVGGPQPDASVEWSVGGVVANVSSTGVVEGLRHGTTVLTGRAVGINAANGQRIIYSQDSIDVHVVPLLGVRIIAPIPRMRVGTTMPVWISGVPDQITPLMLGAARVPLTFHWTTSTREIAHLHHALDKTGIEVDDEDRISMRLTAKEPGRTVLHVTVAVPSVMTGSSGVKMIDTSLEVEVFGDLRLISPSLASVQQSPFILMAPGSSVQLRTNRESSKQLRYSVQASGIPGPTLTPHDSEEIRNLPVVRVDRHGLVQSEGTTGRTGVEVSAREEFGLRQCLTVTIEVKPVSYMLLSANTDWRAPPGEVLHRLPQGLDLKMTASFHDNTGAAFTSAPSDLKMRTNRFDLIALTRGEENGTVLARILRSGQTMMKVWDDVSTQHVADYLKISTEDIIFPNKMALLTEGDAVCLTALSADGRWSSDDDDVLSLNAITGSGVASGSGWATVRFHYSALSSVHSNIEVQPLTEVKFLRGEKEHLINPSSDTVFSAPLVLRNAAQPDKESNLVQPRAGPCKSPSTLPFTCSLAFTSGAAWVEVLAVYPALHTDTGTYSCDVIAAGPPTLSASTLRTNISLRVTAGKLSDTAVYLFHPALYVHGGELRLSARGAGTIQVSGTPEVLASVQVLSDGDVIAVDTRDQRDATTIHIPVELGSSYVNQGAGQELFVTVRSDLTQQSIKVPVRVVSSGSDLVCSDIGPLSERVYTYSYWVVALIAILVSFSAIKWGCSNLNQPPPHQAMVSSSPLSPYPHSIYESRSAFSENSPPVYGIPQVSFQSPGPRHRFH